MQTGRTASITWLWQLTHDFMTFLKKKSRNIRFQASNTALSADDDINIHPDPVTPQTLWQSVPPSPFQKVFQFTLPSLHAFAFFYAGVTQKTLTHSENAMHAYSVMTYFTVCLSVLLQYQTIRKGWGNKTEAVLSPEMSPGNLFTTNLQQQTEKCCLK